jgi:uncharacterized zinc-type alcohol dehydrogenase-like protein
MSTTFKAYAASDKGAKLQPFEFNPGSLRDEQVEIQVEYCGVCHSDLSMLDNDWGQTAYPFVPGHEVAGRVVAAGDKVKGVKVGQRVGLGWFAESCMACPQCLSGNHNLCPTVEQTIVKRHGGFADRVRCHWAWAVPLPDALDSKKSGPLFCGGITVFNPILQCGVLPLDRVGVIGIGGLGHMALQFLKKWGCEVTAFTSSDSKRDEAMKFGAQHVVNSRDAAQLQKIAGSLDFILCTANVTLPWDAIIGSLAPRGRLHMVGAVLEPIPVAAFALIAGQKSISGSPLGSPFNLARMLDFSARHDVVPMIEVFPMSKVNEALDHLRAGKARYRIVLQSDIR